MAEILARIRTRRGTAAAWTTADPILALGEEGYETDTLKKKVGDGTNPWSVLSYIPYSTITQTLIDTWDAKQDVLPVADESNFGIVKRATNAEALAGTETTKFINAASLKNAIDSAISVLINNSPEALDTLDELAQALGDDPDFATTVTTAIGLRVLTSDIEDVLTSSATNHPLSANQGLVLKGLIDSINSNLANYVLKSSIVDNLTSTATDQPLSANQGKNLNDTKLNIAIASGSGTELVFTTDRRYGTLASPETGDITSDLTGAKESVSVLLIHNDGTEPSFDAKFYKLATSADYATGEVNLIECAFIGEDTIIYSISQFA